MSATTCAVCGARVRVSNGALVKHRAPGGGGLCDNAGTEATTNSAGAPELRHYADRLDALGLDPLAEPLGWRCRSCEGRMTVPDAPGGAALAGVLDLLVDAARQHADGGCDR